MRAVAPQIFLLKKIYFSKKCTKFTQYVPRKYAKLAWTQAAVGVFYEKGVTKHFVKFTWKHLCHSLFLINKRRLGHRSFSANFAKFLKALFFNRTPLEHCFCFNTQCKQQVHFIFKVVHLIALFKLNHIFFKTHIKEDFSLVNCSFFLEFCIEKLLQLFSVKTEKLELYLLNFIYAYQYWYCCDWDFWAGGTNMIAVASAASGIFWSWTFLWWLIWLGLWSELMYWQAGLFMTLSLFNNLFNSITSFLIFVWVVLKFSSAALNAFFIASRTSMSLSLASNSSKR